MNFIEARQDTSRDTLLAKPADCGNGCEETLPAPDASQRRVRVSIVNEAMTWLSTPYHHAAGIKGAGVDCAQILIEVYSSVGLIDKLDAGYYPSDWMLHRSEERYLGYVEKYAKQVDTPAMGDIVLFKFGRCFSHSGIVVDYPIIIHAQREDGCCYADAGKGALAGREVRFYSLFPKEISA